MPTHQTVTTKLGFVLTGRHAEVYLDLCPPLVPCPPDLVRLFRESCDVLGRDPNNLTEPATPPPPPAPVGEAPGWFRKLVNFTGAAVTHVWAGLPETAAPELSRRVELCLACDRLNPATGACRECGCKVAVKTRWAGQSCPLGKW